jgi:hypothetical protein
MSRLRSALLVAAALLACAGFSTSAQARWVPGGSYADSCRNVRYDGDALTATCRRQDGAWRNTWLPNAGDCEGNIVNDNGQLECAFGRERDVDRNDSDGGPSGPYERSCTNIRMEGYTLKATCQRNDGSWRWSELEYAYDCDDRIRNSNGRLVCRGGY